jgi:hypothetical protein
MDQNINPIGIAYVAGPETPARLQASRDARRSRNAIRRLHRHALRTDDMEATRHFYEDLIGMPMVQTVQGEVDPNAGRLFCSAFSNWGTAAAWRSSSFFQRPAGLPPNCRRMTPITISLFSCPSLTPSCA